MFNINATCVDNGAWSLASILPSGSDVGYSQGTVMTCQARVMLVKCFSAALLTRHTYCNPHVVTGARSDAAKCYLFFLFTWGRLFKRQLETGARERERVQGVFYTISCCTNPMKPLYKFPPMAQRSRALFPWSKRQCVAIVSPMLQIIMLDPH